MKVSSRAELLAAVDALRSNRLQQLAIDGLQALAPVHDELCGALRANTSLVSLEVAWCSEQVVHALGVGRVLMSSKHLKELTLTCFIRCEGARALAEGLQCNSSLQLLRLRHNGIGRDGAAALAECFWGACSLVQLDLSGNQAGSEGGALLAESLRRNSSLRELNLMGNGIGPAGAVALGRALRNNAPLKMLHRMFDPSIGVGATAMLGRTLYQSKTILEKLVLGNNRIGPEGAAALGEALLSNTSLQLLNLSGNGIDTKGGVAMGQALRQSSLRTLKLTGNDIGPAGAVALGQALQHNDTLQELQVGWNRIGNEGMAALARGLCSNTCLQELHAGGNDFGSPGVLEVGQALRANSSLRCLTLDVNFDHTDRAVLEESLRVNTSLSKVRFLIRTRTGKRIAQALREADRRVEL